MLPDSSTCPIRPSQEAQSPYIVTHQWRPLLYGLLLILGGFGLYLTTVLLAAFSRLIPGLQVSPLLHATIWYSGMPVFA